MEFIYNNKETGSFAEFTIKEVDENLSDEKAIDALIGIIKTFDDKKGIFLPQELLLLIEDEDFDLFLLAAYSKEICNRLEDMFFVVKYNQTIIDQHGMKYNVDYIGKKKAVISFETIEGLAVFNIPAQDLYQGTFDSTACNKEIFG